MPAPTPAAAAAAAAMPLSTGSPGLQTRRRSAIRGAFFSEFIDMFDIYLPVVVLAPALGYFQPQHLPRATAAILASLVFVTTLLGRPFGALLFGLVADRVGRRRASIYSVSGFGVVTLLIAMLPGYEHIGTASYALLVLLRFIDGIFLGGGYTGAMPLALEYARKPQRGLVGGFIMAAFCAAYLSINLVAMLMLALFPLGGQRSAYVQWGWRIPFVIGAALALLLAYYYARHVAESELWQSGTATPAAPTTQGADAANRQAQRAAPPLNLPLPLWQLLHGDGARRLVQVLLLMSGFWLTQNLITIFLPTGLLRDTLHLGGYAVTSTLMVTYLALFFSYIGSGVLAQHIGRRRFFMLAGPLIASVGAALLYTLDSGRGLGLAPIMALVCALAVLVTAPWGVLVTYVNERFATDMRATGFGVAYSFSLILPSFYAFYMNWLGRVLPMRLTPVALLCLGGLLGMLGAWLGPETRHADL
jgi:MFS family permease